MTARTYRFMAVLALAGTALAAVRLGSEGALGFALGSAFSIVNFWLWHRMVRRLGEAKPGGTLSFLGRYLILAAGGYVILNVLEASVLAALAGCLIAVVSLILEILLELTYGT
ncbi:MAG: ATP synthase subunit I [Bryobacteraceae bacterium]|nr:ATP synthase subunit I [Bryobacteraceae bacterium]